MHTSKQLAAKIQVSNNRTLQRKTISNLQNGFDDNRSEAVLQRNLQECADNSCHAKMFSRFSDNRNVIPATDKSLTNDRVTQLFSYSAGVTRTVTVNGSAGKKRSFNECTYNKVDYNAGDSLDTSGTITSTPASWATWLVNKKGGNNATQLHVVNKRWGGKGGQNDGNIVPGTPAENSHHLHEGEKKFDEFFTGGVATKKLT